MTFRNLATYLSFLCLLSLVACGGPQPEAASTDKGVASTEAPDLMEKEEVVRDVIEHTQEANPEFVAEEKLPVKPVAAAGTEQPTKTTTAPKAPKPAPTTQPAASSSPATAEKPADQSVSSEERTTEVTTAAEPAPQAPTPPDHSAWNALLKQYVSTSGDVNYARLKNQEAALDAYLATLAEATPDKDWGRNASMAYWINAYNAFTVKRILDNWPVKSIMDLDGGKTWDVKWIDLDGKTYSLNQIEHEILRPKYGDPRIHFAVNCAAASCPPLANRAFTASNLNGMLESLTRKFINNGRYNQIEAGAVKVSKIFDWYGSDFGDLRTYLNKYLDDPIAESTEIQFRDYDWSLNN
ncbi:DUF547 domain-containing protein [Lewinella sp. W8]|uniref:DUF547 domain-containing protein n=1 Tax=Lewinella sp. W8 TaxID=2528208 RepID=UPI001565E05F|nr:DUF547 domain-containing protein [Lewinella sp. W8]